MHELLLMAGGVSGGPTPPASFDISTATYVQSFSVSGQDTQPQSVRFNPAGTRMYVLGGNGMLFQYDLSTAFDVSTATYNNVSQNISATIASPQSINFSTNGFMLFVANSAGVIRRFNMSNAFNISTLSTTNTQVSVAPRPSNASTFTFSSDGMRMFTGGGNVIYQHNLSSAFNIASATFSNNSVTVNGVTGSGTPTVSFTSDGMRMLVSGLTATGIFQYDLTTPFDLSTATYSNNMLTTNDREIRPTAAIVANSDSKVYLLGFVSDSVHEYDI